MNKHIQIREVPEELHRELKQRAVQERMSMSDYVKRLIERDLKRPNWEAFEKGRAKMGTIDLDVSIAQMVREERDSR